MFFKKTNNSISIFNYRKVYIQINKVNYHDNYAAVGSRQSHYMKYKLKNL